MRHVRVAYTYTRTTCAYGPRRSRPGARTYVERIPHTAHTPEGCDYNCTLYIVRELRQPCSPPPAMSIPPPPPPFVFAGPSSLCICPYTCTRPRSYHELHASVPSAAAAIQPAALRPARLLLAARKQAQLARHQHSDGHHQTGLKPAHPV